MSSLEQRRALRGPIISGLLIGLGLGGFVDGILLHQLLQWHHMLSSVVPPVTLLTVKYNMVFDGLFHLVTWLFTVVGVVLLVRAGHRGELQVPTRIVFGAALAGWGVFNFVEGLIDHQLLGLHHVHPGADQLAWDVAFLLCGVGLIAVGVALIRSGEHEWTNTTRPEGPRTGPRRPIPV